MNWQNALWLVAGAGLGSFLVWTLVRLKKMSKNEDLVRLNRGFEKALLQAFNLGSSLDDFSINSNRQFIAVQQAYVLIRGVVEKISEGAKKAHLSFGYSQESHQVAVAGKKSADQMVKIIEAINQSNDEIAAQIALSNQEISKVIDAISEISKKAMVINDIVFQTKLLSFNASIEAARAGEHGKGFSVVAEEMGKLAGVTGTAALEIRSALESNTQLIESVIQLSQARINELMQKGITTVRAGVSDAEKCGRTIQEIVANADRSMKSVREIMEGADSQKQSILEISEKISQLEKVSEQNSDSALLCVDSSEQLSQESSRLHQKLMKVFTRPKEAEPSFSSSGPIYIGMVNALSGSAASMGTGMRDGTMVAFQAVNRLGGVRSRPLELICRDDAYDPAQTLIETQKMIERDKVFCLFGFVGTATSASVVPLLQKHQIPFLAPFTGAQKFRVPHNSNIFNVRASYGEEAEALTQFLTATRGYQSIGILIQDDAYGAAGELAVVRALKKRGMRVHSKGVYARGATDVRLAVSNLSESQPQAVIMVGTNLACASFVKESQQAGLQAQFCNLSFLGTVAFMEAVGDAGEGVIISQVVPSPWSQDFALAARYRSDMKAAGFSRVDYSSFEGYIASQMLIEGLKRVSGQLTRAKFRQSLETIVIDEDQFKLAWSQDSHCASDRVWLTQIKRGECVSLDYLRLMKQAA
jgi:ABC-type branched-subunit amino acid transport system substrate-binding protein